MKTKYRPHILGERLTFFEFDQRINWEEMFDINEECDKNGKAFNKDFLWVKWSKCIKSIIAMMSVLLGEEINKQRNEHFKLVYLRVLFYFLLCF